MSFCTACGHPIEEGVRFCTSCGRPAGSSVDVTEAIRAQTESTETAVHRTAPEPAIAIPAPETSGTATGTPPVDGELGEPSSTNTSASSTPSIPVQTDHATPTDSTGPAGAVHSPYPDAGSAPSRRLDSETFGHAAAEARARVGAGVQRIPVPQEQMVMALRHGALIAIGAWLVGVVLFALIDMFAEGNAAPILWARYATVLVGLTVGADATLGGTVEEVLETIYPNLGSLVDSLSDGSITGSGSISYMPLALTAGLLVTVSAVTRRAERKAPSASSRDRIIRAVIVGLAFGVVATALALTLRGGVTPDSPVVIGANSLQVFAFGTLLTTVSAFGGFESQADGVATRAAWRGDVRTGLEFVVATIVTASAALLVAVLWAGAQSPVPLTTNESPRDGLAEFLALVAVILLIVPTLVTMGAGALMGASVVMTWTTTTGWPLDGDAPKPRTMRFGLLEGTLPGQYILIGVALCLLAAVVVGLRAALRSDAMTPRARLWQPVVVAAAFWLALAWLSSVSVEAMATSESGSILERLTDSASGTTNSVVALGLLSVAVAAAVWTALAVWLGRLLVTRLGRNAPSLLTFVGGRQMDESWQVLLTDALLRRGQQPPKRLAVTADGLRNGSIPVPEHPLV